MEHRVEISERGVAELDFSDVSKLRIPLQEVVLDQDFLLRCLYNPLKLMYRAENINTFILYKT